MPTSDLHNIAPVLTVIQGLDPGSVLDVGCGFGKYGVLLREYLDIVHGRLHRTNWEVRLEAIEAFAGYRNELWEYAYDAVHIGRAEVIVPTLGMFDVVLLGDVIEHLEKEAAVKLIVDCLEHSSTLVVATPLEFAPQSDVNRNPFEIHRCLWNQRDFPPGVSVVTIPARVCNIYVASKQPVETKVWAPATLQQVLYLRARHKLRPLGKLAWPLAAGLRVINGWLA